jgi:hypothetical protein
MVPLDGHFGQIAASAAAAATPGHAAVTLRITISASPPEKGAADESSFAKGVAAGAAGAAEEAPMWVIDMVSPLLEMALNSTATITPDEFKERIRKLRGGWKLRYNTQKSTDLLTSIQTSASTSSPAAAENIQNLDTALDGMDTDELPSLNISASTPFFQVVSAQAWAKQS